MVLATACVCSHVVQASLFIVILHNENIVITSVAKTVLPLM